MSVTIVYNRCSELSMCCFVMLILLLDCIEKSHESYSLYVRPILATHKPEVWSVSLYKAVCINTPLIDQRLSKYKLPCLFCHNTGNIVLRVHVLCVSVYLSLPYTSPAFYRLQIARCIDIRSDWPLLIPLGALYEHCVVTSRQTLVSVQLHPEKDTCTAGCVGNISRFYDRYCGRVMCELAGRSAADCCRQLFCRATCQPLSLLSCCSVSE